jgi:hypothetical protein
MADTINRALDLAEVMALEANPWRKEGEASE